MTLFSPATLILVTTAVVLASPADARQRHKWWQSGDIKVELDITDAQSESIETIYQAVQPKLRTLMETLNLREETLSELIDRPDAEEWEVAEKIDEVEAARGALSKERLLMIYRMNRELSVEQRAGLREWMETNRRRSRRSPGSR